MFIFLLALRIHKRKHQAVILEMITKGYPPEGKIMSKKQKKEPTLKCPLSQEQKDFVNDVADVVDKHKKIINKLNPLSP
jgi:hypothetical protein